MLCKLTEDEVARLEVLFLTRFAPRADDPPPPEVDPEVGRERLTKYEVGSALRGLGLRVANVETLDAFRAYEGPANYVFCLYNREPIRNPETVVASLCAQKRLPHLGAPPNVRALAEDKLLTKGLAGWAGLPVAPGWVATSTDDLVSGPAFDGPYFVKPRFGANSEGIGEHSVGAGWPQAAEVAAGLLAEGEEVIVEPLIDGRDLTVTVLAGDPPMALTPTLFVSDLAHGIATERQKRLLAGGRSGRPLTGEPALSTRLKEMALRFAALARPFDYMRVDFRQDLDGRLWLMEANLTSNLGTHAATGIAIRHDGIAHRDLIEHLVACSIRRQRVLD